MGMVDAETTTWNPNQIRLNVARDLRDIVEMCGRLDDEAVEHPNDRELPGGEALNLAGPAASLEAWDNRFGTAERNGADTRHGSDQESPLHPLLVVGDWSEKVRHERGDGTDLRVTVDRAAAYLRSHLGWCIDEFDDVGAMAHELRACVLMLENVLNDGTRSDASATACFKDVGHIDEPRLCGGRLTRRTLQRRDCEHVDRAIDMAKGISDPVVVLRQTLLAFPEDEKAHQGCDQGGRDDVYRCRDCDGFYTEAEYWLAVKQQHEKEAG